MSLPVAAALSSFRDYYHDATGDEHNNNIYAPLDARLRGAQWTKPGSLLRDLSTNNPEMTSVGYIIHCRDPLNPAARDLVTCKAFTTSLGTRLP